MSAADGGRGGTDPLVGVCTHPYDGWPSRPATMAKKKDCFGSETYVCRTQNCAYMSECVQVVWEKKLRRILARRPSDGRAS